MLSPSDPGAVSVVFQGLSSHSQLTLPEVTISTSLCMPWQTHKKKKKEKINANEQDHK